MMPHDGQTRELRPRDIRVRAARTVVRPEFSVSVPANDDRSRVRRSSARTRTAERDVSQPGEIATHAPTPDDAGTSVVAWIKILAFPLS